MTLQRESTLKTGSMQILLTAMFLGVVLHAHGVKTSKFDVYFCGEHYSCIFATPVGDNLRQVTIEATRPRAR